MRPSVAVNTLERVQQQRADAMTALGLLLRANARGEPTKAQWLQASRAYRSAGGAPLPRTP